jgi:TatD DNase family protein
MNKPAAYIDTHCHLDSVLNKMKLNDLSELKKQFSDLAPEAFIHIACDAEAIPFFERILESEADVFGAVGIHPHDASTYNSDLHQKITELMANPKVLAWGEIGLDYHYDFSPREVQMDVFKTQLRGALSLNKALVIHTREAEADTLNELGDSALKNLPMHIHCFTGDLRFYRELKSTGNNLFFGFTGVITFKNSDGIREVVQNCGEEEILLETDAPYMAPTPWRGQIAHSGMIPQIVKSIAAIRNKSESWVYGLCRNNTRNMYGI